MNSIIIDNPPDLPPDAAPKAICAFGVQVEDHIKHSLDLNKFLIKHPAATFFIRADGAMRELGILHGDLLVVDRALVPQHDSIVVAVLHGEFTIKRLKMISGQMFLYSDKNHKPLAVSKNVQFWGVVTHAIHDVRPG